MAPRTGRVGLLQKPPSPSDLLIFITKEADCENGKRLHNPRPCEEMSRVEREGDQQAGQRWPGQGGALNIHPSARRAGLEMSAECRSPRSPRLGCLQLTRPAPRELSRRPRPRLPGRSPRRAALLPPRPASPARSSPQPGRLEGSGVGAASGRG